jgi:hypothetical protein
MIALAGTGCVDTVPTLHVATVVHRSVLLAPPDDQIPTEFGHYRWVLVTAPASATPPTPTEPTATVSLLMTRRGIYVYDRWFVSDAADQLSYHVVVTVDGAPPLARISGPTTGAVGQASAFSGAESSSAELRALAYEWRLAVRPQSSSAQLADSQNATVTVIPDVTGEYYLELRVFDGELWSEPAVRSLVVDL